MSVDKAKKRPKLVYTLLELIMTEDQKSTETVPPQEASETEKLKEEVTKWKNDFLYLKAEFDNYKKNVLKERSELLKYGSERVSKDVLDVVDNFDRALEFKISTDNVDNFKKGIEMTAKELKEVLTKHGVQELPGLGQPFNPQFFEAISSEPTNKYSEGSISQVFKKAYKLHDKVLRMGQVVVAKKPIDGDVN